MILMVQHYCEEIGGVDILDILYVDRCFNNIIFFQYDYGDLPTESEVY
jgi:hypothetical protein